MELITIEIVLMLWLLGCFGLNARAVEVIRIVVVVLLVLWIGAVVFGWAPIVHFPVHSRR